MWRIILVTLALAALPRAHADQLDFSTKDELRRQEREKIVADTTLCMYRMLDSLLWRGFRDRDQIAAAMIKQCVVHYQPSIYSIPEDEGRRMAYEVIELKFGPRKDR